MRLLGLSRLKSLDPVEPVIRYEREAPGDLLHIDTKRLGKIKGLGHRVTGDRTYRHTGMGWEVVHLAVDDHSRVACALITDDAAADHCCRFLRDTATYFQRLGVTISRVMTDNGSGYVSKAFKETCEELGIRHLRTRPYTPKTNGKVERFVQTSLREWAYAKPYRSSALREAALQPFIHHYNWHRPHSALAHQPPMIRIPAVNDLMKLNN